jgi:hypothetical protein
MIFTHDALQSERGWGEMRKRRAAHLALESRTLTLESRTLTMEPGTEPRGTGDSLRLERRPRPPGSKQDFSSFSSFFFPAFFV